MLLALPAVQASTGCGDGISPPSSPVVAADSEEGKKAREEDEALRELRRRQEAKALSRKRGFKPPVKG